MPMIFRRPVIINRKTSDSLLKAFIEQIEQFPIAIYLFERPAECMIYQSKSIPNMDVFSRAMRCVVMINNIMCLLTCILCRCQSNAYAASAFISNWRQHTRELEFTPSSRKLCVMKLMQLCFSHIQT